MILGLMCTIIFQYQLTQVVLGKGYKMVVVTDGRICKNNQSTP